MAAIRGIADTMSDVLSLVRMRGDLVCVNECAAPFSLRFSDPVAHFHIIEHGTAFLTVGDEPPLRVHTGDLAILPLGAGHVLSSKPSLTPVPIEQAVAQMAVRSGAVYRLGSERGPPTHMVCGKFKFEGVLASRLLAVLPAVIHIKAQDGQPLDWLRWTSNLLAEETRAARPGSSIMLTRLLDVFFIQVLREWSGRNPDSPGWLSGLMDQHVGKALGAIHDQPARDWTVESLAARSGLSRSAFAARFAATVGQPPLQYLTSWRLNLAADQLRAGAARIGEIAAKVGYGSEAALTRAFKAQFGTTPAAFRRGSSPPQALAS